MRKLAVVFLAALLLFPAIVSAQEEQAGDTATTPAATTPTATTPAAEPNWENLDDMQMALMLLTKQYDYLLARLEDSDKRIKDVTADYENRLQKENDRYNELKTDYESKLAKTETELKTAQDRVNKLERDAALFNSDSGVYLKIVLGFLAGLVAGFILAAIMRLWRSISKQAA